MIASKNAAITTPHRMSWVGAMLPPCLATANTAAIATSAPRMLPADTAHRPSEAKVLPRRWVVERTLA